MNIIKSIMMVAMLALGGYADSMNESNSKVDGMEIDIFYMYSVDDGSYWLDPTTDTENVIWIDDESLVEWNVNKEELHHGNRMVGMFDKTGWELLGMKGVQQ
ncbi:hypothetical protein ABE073_04105 [Lederbergia citrisecunda]|uniref:hypothetical protein n=1 Tax=Lederbergia citrisecunda TaxID=2833583 RepID=UPI003D26635C